MTAAKIELWTNKELSYEIEIFFYKERFKVCNGHVIFFRVKEAIVWYHT